MLYHETNDVEYYVRRGRKPLKLDFACKDSTYRNYLLTKKLSPAFLLANYITPMGIGYVVDLFHEKRFMYPPRNYFSYDTTLHQIKHDVIKPSARGDLQFSLGWNFLNVYHPSLFPNHHPDFSLFGFKTGVDYFLYPKRSLQMEIGYSFRQEPFISKRRYTYNAPIDSTIKWRTTNFWLSVNYKIRLRRFVLGSGLILAGLKHYEKKEYYLTYDSVQLLPLDTFGITRLAYSRSKLTPLIKTGLNFKVEYKINNYMAVGTNWQFFLLDVIKPKAYASHFFDFYLNFNLYETRLKLKKSRHASN